MTHDKTKYYNIIVESDELSVLGTPHYINFFITNIKLFD